MKLKNLTLFFVLVFSTLNGNANVRVVPTSDLVALDRHIKATELVTHILTTYHYKKTKLNDELSSSIFTNYFDNLDQNKNYFINSDIERFERFRYVIDDAIKNKDISLAYEIFKKYRNRVEERINFALEIVNYNFDFSIEESFRFDRRDDNWLNNISDLDELWRKRVKNDVLNLKLAGKNTKEIKKTLSERYNRILSTTLQLDSNDVFQTFINAYTTSIEPHTAYFSPRISENFDISMRLSLEGIGAVLRAESEYTQVVRIITGGPADLDGRLGADDRIISVGQNTDGEMVDVIGWRLDDVVDLIRGPKNTMLKLEVLPKGSGIEGPTKIITLTRDKIKLEEQDASSSIINIPETNTKIGVIELPAFYIDFAAQAAGQNDYKSTSRDVRKLISVMMEKKIDGLIIDLRGNGGGSLAEALELTGFFIDEGPVVQTKDATGRIEINYDPQPGIVYPGPLAVLVDRDSASASEIFAGAIQDYRRGIIIGETTFGKGTVQNVIDLNRFIQKDEEDYGRLKTTIAQFFRISGSSNQYKGVVPDIMFPTTEYSDKNLGERAYENALPWDKVKPAKYYTTNAPTEIFDDVKKQHESRIKKNKLFQLILNDINSKQKNSTKKEISLLESERKLEREKNEETKVDIENIMRQEKGLPPLDSSKNISEALDDEKNEQIDVLLNEAAEILNDLIIPNKNIDIRTVQALKN
ncbi:MAG: tail-specific protease [Legionellales bacterium]|nr:tail-specific protease [Legionellales bacterium]HBH11469.1 tail-specific protease [Gammaproteobacteria bacterium]